MESLTKPKDLTQICREYAKVELRDEAYDSELRELKGRIDSSYKSGMENYEADVSKIEEILGELAGIKDVGERRFFGLLRVKKEQENSDAGEFLYESLEKLKTLREAVNSSYNKYAEAVNALSKGVREGEKLASDYEKRMKTLEGKILSVYEINTSPEKLRALVEGNVAEKLGGKKSEEVSEEDKQKLIGHFLKEGERELESLCKNYLMLQNDLPIARGLALNSDAIEKYHKLINSFSVLRENLLEDVAKIQAVANVYQLVTKSQLDAIENMEIPEEMFVKVMELVHFIEETDDEFSQKAMRGLFRNSDVLRTPEIGGVMSGMIGHIREEVNKNPDSRIGEVSRAIGEK